MTALSKWALALYTILLSATALANGNPVPVPEPGSFGLMAVGVVALVAATLRKRK